MTRAEENGQTLVFLKFAAWLWCLKCSASFLPMLHQRGKCWNKHRGPSASTNSLSSYALPFTPFHCFHCHAFFLCFSWAILSLPQRWCERWTERFVQSMCALLLCVTHNGGWPPCPPPNRGAAWPRCCLSRVSPLPQWLAEAWLILLMTLPLCSI